MSELSPSLASRGITLRPEQPADGVFLETLFVSIRWPEFDGAGWSDEVRRNFLAHQFALQSRHYADCYRGAEWQIVERTNVEGNAAPVGRLCLLEGQSDVRIVDISLVPEVRGAGLGAALLNAVKARAAARDRKVSIHVERNNPARRLYQRLGFAFVHEQGPYLLLEWKA